MDQYLAMLYNHSLYISLHIAIKKSSKKELLQSPLGGGPLAFSSFSKFSSFSDFDFTDLNFFGEREIIQAVYIIQDILLIMIQGSRFTLFWPTPLVFFETSSFKEAYVKKKAVYMALVAPSRPKK